jgi:peptide/nickel transport system permease protein
VLAAALKRGLELLTIAFGVSVLTFLMIHLIPGDAVQDMLGANAETSPAQIGALRQKLGLDQPLLLQYLHWAASALRGDLGTSIWTGTPVLAEIAPRLGVTFELTLLALAVAAGLAIPLGCLIATASTGWASALTRLLSIVGLTMPSFWLGTMLLYAVAALLPDADLLGWVPFADDPAGHVRRLILPVIALALPAMAAFARVLRAAMIEVLRQDYIRTARAPKRPTAVPDQRRHHGRLPLRRLRGDRAGLRHPRPRPADARRHRRTQLPAGPGQHPAGHAHLRLRQRPGGHPLRRRRPEAAPGLRGLLWTGAALVGAQAAAALLAPLIAPYAPTAQDVLARLRGPTASHWLGTDNFGRDTLSRILFGYQTLFAVCAGAVLVALLLGGGLGVLAAWRGLWFDRIAMRLMDILFAFPLILLAIGIVAVLGPGVTATATAIAIVYLPIFARTLRAPALQLRHSDFIAAARATGASDLRILTRHLLPNLAPIILVQSSLSLSTAILVEASLSFLGLGTPPPAPSLGRMLAESRNFLLLSPWAAIFSGAAILLASLGFNLLGDALQDRLDPRLR